MLDRFQPHKEQSFRLEIDVPAFLPAVMRRVHPTVDSLVLGQLRFDFKRYSVTRGKRLAEFTQRELEVLQYMSERAGTVVTREELLRKI